MNILKIGGSVLTRKDSEDKLVREDVLQRIVFEVAPRKEGLILVHGAGSFGHPEADAYRLSESFNIEGVLKTHESVCTLNRRVVSELVRVGVPAVAVPPMGCALADGGALVSMELAPLRQMVERGLVPVLHGDVVMDCKRGASVVSGDTLVPYIAMALGVRRVGMATDTHGVLDMDKNTVPVITEHNIEKVRHYLTPPERADVTGWMAGKLEKLLMLAEHGIQSWIFSGIEEGNIAAFLDGRPVGTLVAFEKR